MLRAGPGCGACDRLEPDMLARHRDIFCDMSHDGVIGSPQFSEDPRNCQPHHRWHALLHLDAHQHARPRGAHHVTGSRADRRGERDLIRRPGRSARCQVQNPEGLHRGARPVASRCTPPPWAPRPPGSIPRRSRRSCATRSVQPRIRRPPSWKRGGPCGSADVTYGGGLRIPTGGELGTLKKVGAIVTEALYAVSVRPLWKALRRSHGPLQRHPSLVSRGARVTCHGPGPRAVVVASP